MPPRDTRSQSPSTNFGAGRQFRVNYVCPDCGVHMRVPIEGYGRNGWNCRIFKCVKCGKTYTMHIATTVHEGVQTPPVGRNTAAWFRAERKSFNEDVDHLDLVFFNGHVFRPMFITFLQQLIRTVESLRKKVPGFSLLFPEEDKHLLAMIEAGQTAAKNCREQYEIDCKETWRLGKW